MKPMPWRILVVTDAGVDSGRPARVAPGGADGWLASLGATIEVPAAGGAAAAGARAARIAISNAASFAPAAIASQRAGAGGSPVPAAAIDAVLHAPAFQRLESAWRGLSLLLEHAREAVSIEVLSLPRKGLAARFREAVFEPARSAADPLSLILLDFDFSHKPDDLAAVADLAGMAKVLQAPIVAAASPAFFDFRFLVQAVGLPDLLERLGDNAHAPWRAFQATEPARWAALTINRYLQRAPYTADGGGHAEMVSESNPDSYLWGRGAWLVAAAVARSVNTHGHALDLAGGTGGGFSGLATRPFAVKANESVPLATEVALAEMQALELSRAAFTPIVGPLRRDVALIPIAVTAFRLKPGKLSVEGTIAYQLTAARLAQFCGRLLDEMPAADAATVAAFFRSELIGFLGPLAGETPDEVVTVEVIEDASAGGSGPIASVKIKPPVTLEGKVIDFEFGLPLTR